MSDAAGKEREELPERFLALLASLLRQPLLPPLTPPPPKRPGLHGSRLRGCGCAIAKNQPETVADTG